MPKLKTKSSIKAGFLWIA